MKRKFGVVVLTALLAYVGSAQAAGETGLRAQYHKGITLSNPAVIRTDPGVNFDWKSEPPFPGLGSDGFSVRWSGMIRAKYSQTYTFHTNSDDGVRLWVNGEKLIDNWSIHAAQEDTGRIKLVAGQTYTIQLEYYEKTGNAVAQLLWSGASQVKQIVAQNYLVPPPDVDPSWYATPDVQGTGLRKITVFSGESLQDAFNKAAPGDIIELQDGEHRVSDGLYLSRSGTSNHWIAVRAAPGASPRINLDNTGSFQIAASNILVEGLEIVNGLGDNLHIAPWTSSIRNIVVRDMKIHSLRTGSGAAIKINRNNAANASVERVYIENSDLQQPVNNAVVDGVGVRTAVVRNCWIHEPGQGNSGIFFKGGSSQILIEKNLISGIRGNSAVLLGGNSGAQYFDPAYPNQEGVDQVARNNLIADYDDSAVEIRGVARGSVYHNTIVGDSVFAIFRLNYGNTSTAGGKSGNQQISISDNIVINTASTAVQYARNDANTGDFRFGPQVWAGLFTQFNSAGLPTFPQVSDVKISRFDAGKIVRNPTHTDLSGLADAKARYMLTADSPAKGRASGDSGLTSDILDHIRSPAAPSIGAHEYDQ